jgi:hypothetical protein
MERLLCRLAQTESHQTDGFATVRFLLPESSKRSNDEVVSLAFG